jgi:hypothetical protein
MHGGAKGSGAPKGKENGRYQHGLFRALIAEMRASAEAILQG